MPLAKKLELLQMLKHILSVYQNTNRENNQKSPNVLELLQQLYGETIHEVLYKYLSHLFFGFSPSNVFNLFNFHISY